LATVSRSEAKAKRRASGKEGCSAALICGMPEPLAPGKKRSVAQTMPAVISGVVSSTAQGQAR
jgi:hypothetical protein